MVLTRYNAVNVFLNRYALLDFSIGHVGSGLGAARFQSELARFVKPSSSFAIMNAILKQVICG